MNQKKFLLIAALTLAATIVCANVKLSARGSSSADSGPSTLNQPPLDEKSAYVRATLPMFRRLSENFLRGAAPLHGGIETLVRLGVRTLVDLRSIYDHTQEVGLAAERAGLSYYWLPLSVWNPPTDDQAKEFVSVVGDLSKGPFYVFCADGLNRTGGMSAIYRIEHHGWAVERSLAEMDDIGFNPYFYTLRNYVWTYARKFRPEAVPQQARRLSSLER